jgi:hypothetical protein
MTHFEFISDSDLTWSLFAELVAASPRALRNAVDNAHLAGIAIVDRVCVQRA